MTHPKGRTGRGPTLRGVRAAACIALALIAAAGACARPGNTPAGTPATPATIVVSATAGAQDHGPSVRAHAGLVPGSAPGGCAAPPPVAHRPESPGPRSPATARALAPAVTPPAPGSAVTGPGQTMGAEEARERARRVLEAQRSAIPRRGDVPPDIAARAAECLIRLRAELNLARAAYGTLTPDDIRAALASAGLTGATVHPDLRFAASTGEACIVGTAGPEDPEAAIAPLAPGGTCRP